MGDVGDTSNVEKSESTHYSMLNYERQIFLDILENDGLTICAKGLNEYTVVLNLLLAYKDPGNLVFVINAAEYEEKYFVEKTNLLPLPTLSVDRQKAYLSGGVYIVSTRVLVVDLLKDRVPVEHVTGIIVLRAHCILESCQEAFILRLYRQKNKVCIFIMDSEENQSRGHQYVVTMLTFQTGFIKAFSHSAEAFTLGFAHVEKVMRNLFVKELFLWPRFHSSIIRDLKVFQPNVIELHVPLSNATKLIQTCILDIMNYTTKELKRINRYLDLQEITSENCLSKNFHKIIQAQLDTVWHQLNNKTKELVQDLKVMRSLILSLLHQDAVTFYCLVSKYTTPEYAKTNSGWILLDSAEQMFKYARSRVYNADKEFEPEPCSKWKYLNEILSVEIPEIRKKNKSILLKSRILVLCNDSKSAKQINEYLTVGEQGVLYQSAQRNNLEVSLLSKRYRHLRGVDDQSNPTQRTADDSLKPKCLESTLMGKDMVAKETVDQDDSYVLTMTQNVKTESGEDTSSFEPFPQIDNVNLTQLECENPLVFIQQFKNADKVCLEETLREIQPDFIILYHSNVAATRQIEVYSARKDETFPPLVVFLLVHAQTTEEQAYLTSLRREKEAFELLIQTKSTMVVPAYQDGKSEITSNLLREDPSAADVPNTRKGGGQPSPVEQPRVIVDMREFRSDLPALLYRKGIDTDPVTISIGDYILTPDICVERKSLSDLIGSLNSGRLYTQCTQMCRNYARPMLLIEFDQNRPFKLVGHPNLVSSGTSEAAVQEKLQLLTLHFPRLKLIWSPSPYATADLFYELKQGKPQPSVSTIGEEGKIDSLSLERYHLRIHDFLLKLPGINSKNICRIMNRGGSLDNLIKLSKDELANILENKSEAETLWAILHNEFTKSDSSNSEVKNVKKNRFGKVIRSKMF